MDASTTELVSHAGEGATVVAFLWWRLSRLERGLATLAKGLGATRNELGTARERIATLEGARALAHER